MFEEEQRLRRGLELSEMQKLDKLLGSLDSGLFFSSDHFSHFQSKLPAVMDVLLK